MNFYIPFCELFQKLLQNALLSAQGESDLGSREAEGNSHLFFFTVYIKIYLNKLLTDKLNLHIKGSKKM